ncbi:hypothetical protein GJAV_G00248260 [Gymnothorax javanicus]|nr:hypothetical protein GJAV_G00248260 [Gymnothorax javanicus]
MLAALYGPLLCLPLIKGCTDRVHVELQGAVTSSPRQRRCSKVCVGTLTPLLLRGSALESLTFRSKACENR